MGVCHGRCDNYNSVEGNNCYRVFISNQLSCQKGVNLYRPIRAPTLDISIWQRIITLSVEPSPVQH